MKTHICLVSKQATPSLLPAIDAVLRPERMVLVVSPDMKNEAAALEGVLKRRGIRTELLHINDAYAYPHIEDTLLDWLTKQADTDEIMLNVTGGTKLMAMAAQSVFTIAKRPIYYINADTDGVLMLGRRDYEHKLQARIGVRDYLEVHGYRLAKNLEQPNIDARLRDLSERLVDHVKSGGSSLGQINWLAQQAKNSLRSPELSDRQRDSIELREMMALFEDADVFKREKNILKFPDENNRQFANGGWLEYHLYRALMDLAPEMGIVEPCMNLHIVAPDGKTKNEIDVAFMHNNRLCIIEAKAGNLANPGVTGDEKSTEALYKLESLLKLGGLRTKAMLVEYRGLLTAADKTRAATSHIQLMTGTQLKQAKGQLRAWLA